MSGIAAARRLAVVVIGTLKVGIDVRHVVQALPPGLAPLPRKRGALAGVADCDGRLVPVADLGRWVETGPGGPEAGRRIVVLRDGGRTIGLLVDAIEGFADATGMTRVHHDEDPDEVFQAAARVPGIDTTLAVLEAGRLIALACAWHEEDAQPPAAAPGVASTVPELDAQPRELCAVLRAGATLLALPAVRLAAVLPRRPLERVGLGATAFCRWGERHVPVVAAPGAEPTLELPLLAIVEHDGAALGIAIDAALDMRPLPVPPADVPVVYDEAGQALAFVDVPALFARHPEAALSKATRAATGPAASGNGDEQLVFDADGVLATPLAGIEQVLPFEAADGAPPATLPWQGRAIPVADLRAAGSRGPRGAVLVVRDGGGHVACVVERVRSLVPRGAGRTYSLAATGQGGATRFITVRDGGSEASYRIVDLAERVRRR